MSIRKLLLTSLLVFSLMLPLAGCSKKNFFSSLGFGPKTPDSVEALAMKGMDYYEQGSYYQAHETFEQLLNLYPFSDYSLLAELKSADSNFYMKNYEEAVLQYMDFEERHPTNEAIPYVMFQIAMCYYEQIDTIDRDIANATNALYSFSRLLRAAPNSPYQAEAEARIKAVKNFLANHEFYVASYYVRTGGYQEAEARLEFLLEQFPESSISPKAERLLYDLKQGDPPGRSLFGWLPKKLPDWEDLTPQE